MNSPVAQIEWQWRTFAALTATELYTVLAAREAVFVVEQACAYQDADGLDVDAVHLVGWDQGAVAAYLRVLSPGIKYAEPSIGRVLTAKTHRGTGAGKKAMTLALDYIAKQFPDQDVRISAQVYIERFYNELGFMRVSEPYLEDDIPHIEMLYSRRAS